MYHLIQGLIIGFLGTALFLAVDYYEPNENLVRFLKISVAVWGAAAVLSLLGVFGRGLFLMHNVFSSGPRSSAHTQHFVGGGLRVQI
jgi:hypothetical protein